MEDTDIRPRREHLEGGYAVSSKYAVSRAKRKLAGCRTRFAAVDFHACDT